jgi:hypothetical protein
MNVRKQDGCQNVTARIAVSFLAENQLPRYGACPVLKGCILHQGMAIMAVVILLIVAESCGALQPIFRNHNEM